MRRSSLIVWFFVLVSLVAGAQDKKGGRLLVWNPPDHIEPPFATQLRKVAVVIEMTCRSTNGTPVIARGTGFTVAYLDPRLPKNFNFQYLVTNRHVAECWDENKRPQEVTSAAVLFDMNDNTPAVQRLQSLQWYFPRDQSADLAVIPIVLHPAAAHVGIPLDMFFTKDLFTGLNMGEGAKIILAGYFYQLQGERRVQPLIREGILSMIPEDPLETTTGKRGQLYLGDVHIFGGNSGSPVFISTAGIRPDGPQWDDDYRFLGVVSGYYYEDSDFKLQIAMTVQAKQRANSGVSMIVPGDILKDLILNNPDLKRFRDASIPLAPSAAQSK